MLSVGHRVTRASDAQYPIFIMLINFNIWDTHMELFMKHVGPTIGDEATKYIYEKKAAKCWNGYGFDLKKQMQCKI